MSYFLVCVLIFALGHQSSWHGRRHSNYLGLFGNQNCPIYCGTFQQGTGLQFCFAAISVYPTISLGHSSTLQATAFKEGGTY